MVKIKDGDGPQKVPLAYYDENGERHVVGEAAVEIKNGEIIALGHIKHGDFDFSLGGLNVEAFSISNPADKHYVISEPKPYSPSPVEEASRRLGPLSMGSRAHVTESNPNGAVRQCDRRDIHEPHEWQAEFGAYFNVYCPGNQGDKR